MNQKKNASTIEQNTIRKLGFRFLPFLAIAYFIAYIDRTNIGFAALEMNASIGLSDAVFGLGSSLFFIAYVLFEVPSNFAQSYFGSRAWIARIMFSWGAVGIAMAFVSGPISFYSLRFLLGAAEAGFFPGVVLYLAQWFPKVYRARIIAMFMVAIPMSSFLGSPLAAMLLSLDGAMSLAGWQWIFISESIPAVMLGFLALKILRNRPEDAQWLSHEEKKWLINTLEEEKKQSLKEASHDGVWQALINKKVWALALIYCGSSATSNVLSVWQPQILKSFGLSSVEASLFNMIPFGCAATFMVVWGFLADRTGDRIKSTWMPLCITSVSLLSTMLTNSLAVTITLLSFALIGNYALKGPFFALVAETLTPKMALVGVAAINSIAHIGTSLAMMLFGALRAQTQSFSVSTLPLVLLTFVGVITTLIIGQNKQKYK